MTKARQVRIERLVTQALAPSQSLSFPYAELAAYLGRFLGCDFSSAPAGRLLVVPSSRRCRRESSYARPFPIVIGLTGKQCIISVRPDIADAVRNSLASRKADSSIVSPAAGQLLVDICRKYLPKRLAPKGWCFSRPQLFTCARAREVPHVPGAVVIDPVSEPLAPRAKGLRPTPVSLGVKGQLSRCVVYRRRIVAECYTISVDDKRIGSIGIETAPSFRGRGLGKMCLAALTRDLIENGLAPEYATAFDNFASIGLARSVGYRLFARMLRVQPR